MRDVLAAAAAGSTVTAAIILAAGGAAFRPELLGMALIAGGSFFDLARRGFAETGLGEGDRTDVWMSAAFATVLVGAAWDHGRDLPLGWDSAFELSLLAAGVFLLVVGFGMRYWAARTLGSDFLVRLDLREEHRLVDSGPYKYVRHPTYAALFLMALGTGLCFVSPVALTATLAVWLPAMLVRVEREERQLVSRYGPTYEAYQRRTWKLVPGAY